MLANRRLFLLNEIKGCFVYISPSFMHVFPLLLHYVPSYAPTPASVAFINSRFHLFVRKYHSNKSLFLQGAESPETTLRWQKLRSMCQSSRADSLFLLKCNILLFCLLFFFFFNSLDPTQVQNYTNIEEGMWKTKLSS